VANPWNARSVCGSTGYGYVVLGEIVGWFIDWDLLLEYTAIVAVVAIGISGYFGFLIRQVGIGPTDPAVSDRGGRGRRQP